VFLMRTRATAEGVEQQCLRAAVTLGLVALLARGWLGDVAVMGASLASSTAIVIASCRLSRDENDGDFLVRSVCFLLLATVWILALTSVMMFGFRLSMRYWPRGPATRFLAPVLLIAWPVLTYVCIRALLVRVAASR
jgi:hypothetical protein